MWFSYSIQLIMNIISEPTHLKIRAAHGFDFFLYVLVLLVYALKIGLEKVSFQVLTAMLSSQGKDA